VDLFAGLTAPTWPGVQAQNMCVWPFDSHTVVTMGKSFAWWDHPMRQANGMCTRAHPCNGPMATSGPPSLRCWLGECTLCVSLPRASRCPLKRSHRVASCAL